MPEFNKECLTKRILKTMRKLFVLTFVCMLAFAGFSQDPGTVDTSFGDNGITRYTPTEYMNHVHSLQVQDDGKIITVGRCRLNGSGWTMYVVRHNADGSMDQTYGTGGINYFKADEGATVNWAHDAVLSENGYLYIAGHTYNGEDNAAFVLCLDENGFPNPYFGNNGLAITSYGNGIVYETLDIDSHGRVVVSGYFNDKLLVSRYNAVGQLDQSFGDSGTTIFESEDTFSSYGYSIKALSNDKIVVVGQRNLSDMSYLPFVCRFKNNGDFDNTFANNGVLNITLSEGYALALSVDVLPNGSYMVAGHDEIYSEVLPIMYEVFVANVMQDGTLNPNFGDNGVTKIATFEGGNTVNYCYGAIAAPDGQIFGTHYSYNFNNGLSRAYVFNLNENGQLNENFAGTGTMAFDFSDPEVQSSEIFLQEDGTLLVAGQLWDGAESTDIFIGKVFTDIEEEEPEYPAAGVEVTAEAVDANNIKVNVTPNEYTVGYHVAAMELSVYDEVGQEAVVEEMQSGELYTEEQELVISELEPLTEYVVIVAAKNEVDEWVVETVTLTTPEGIGCEEFAEMNFNIYPNPATTSIFIETAANNAQVSIIDLTGRCVKEFMISGNTRVSLDGINKGVYFIKLQQDNASSVQKIVVK